MLTAKGTGSRFDAFKRGLFGSSPKMGFVMALGLSAGLCLGLALLTANPLLAGVGVGLALTAVGMFFVGDPAPQQAAAPKTTEQPRASSGPTSLGTAHRPNGLSSPADAAIDAESDQASEASFHTARSRLDDAWEREQSQQQAAATARWIEQTRANAETAGPAKLADSPNGGNSSEPYTVARLP